MIDQFVPLTPRHSPLPSPRRLACLFLVLFLTLPILLPLSGCSRQPDVDPELANLAVYDAVEYEIGNQYSYVQSVIWANGEIVMLASDANGLNSLVRVSPAGQVLGTVPLTAIPGLMTDPSQPATAYLDGVYTGPQNTILVTATDYSDQQKLVRTLYQMDNTGHVLHSLPVSEVKNDGSTTETLNNLQVAPDGNLLLTFNTFIRLIDLSGNRKGEYKLPGQYVALTMFLQNGHVAVSTYLQEGGMKTEEVDLATSTKVRDLNLPPPLFNALPVRGSDGLYYINGNQYLSCYDETTGQVKKLLSWMDLDIDRNNLSYQWVIAPDGSFYFGETIYPETAVQPQADETPANPTFKLLKLTRSADQTVSRKTNITIGAFWIPDSLRRAMISYRKGHPDIRFIVTDYNESIDYSKTTAYEDAITRINADILAGKMPDILMVGQLPWQQYASKGLLVDLGAQMAQDKAFDPSLYLSNYLTAAQYNGKLYTLATAVSLTGIVTSRDLVGDRTGWTVQEFQQFVEQQPDQKNLFYQMPGEGVLNLLLMGNLNAYIDRAKGTASFDSPDFIQLLEFAEKYGVKPEDVQDSLAEVLPADGVSSGPALQMAWLSRFEDYSSFRQTFNGNVALLGLPSAQRSGPMLQTNTPLAIAATSRHRDEVWDFFKFLLSEPQQDLVISGYEGFPILRSSLVRAGAKAIAETADNGQNQPLPADNAKETADVGWQPPRVTQEDVDTVMGILSQATTLLVYDDKASQIISEETQAFFAGNKSAAETAAAIQSRMKAYVGEQQ
jgi:ABC-type glycerol-3-phosphate transport system substrate-binding protein